MIFREISTKSVEYQRALALREEVLRVPLGLSLQDEDLSAEKDGLHFGLFAPDGALAACVMAVPLSAGAAKIRQMAVRPALQRRGLGTRLLREVERILAARGITHLELDSRKSALGFYQKLGYTAVGGEFTAVTLPHVRMRKDLAQRSYFRSMATKEHERTRKRDSTAEDHGGSRRNRN